MPRQATQIFARRLRVWKSHGEKGGLAGDVFQRQHEFCRAQFDRRLRSLGMETMEEYFDFVTRPEQADELVLMLDAITTNETHFFREPKHFEFMSQRLFPRWKAEAEIGARPKRLRIWSAGCSSGEEPYSLAMILLKHFPASEGWSLDILATDLSTQVLAKAKAGVYAFDKARDVPNDILCSHMLQGMGEQEGRMKVGPEGQAVVKFCTLPSVLRSRF